MVRVKPEIAYTSPSAVDVTSTGSSTNPGVERHSFGYSLKTDPVHASEVHRVYCQERRTHEILKTVRTFTRVLMLIPMTQRNQCFVDVNESCSRNEMN